MLRFGGTPAKQWTGRTSQRGGPERPQDQDIQEEAGGLRQRLVRRAPVSVVVHPHNRDQTDWGDPILPGLWSRSSPPSRGQASLRAGPSVRRGAAGRHAGDGPRVGEERRREAALRAARYQQALRRYHCCNIRPRTLEVGDLMLKRVLSREGLHKLSPMWEGPFKVVHVSRPGSVRLETQEGEPIQNAWNIQHLRRFYP